MMDAVTILIADDDVQMRRALRLRLEASGCRVLECGDGLGAISKSRMQHVDAVILDHEMPLGAGRTIVGNIRRHSSAPIIFVSGHSREEFRQIVTQYADTYFLPKPLDGSQLVDLLDSVLGEAQGNTIDHAAV